MSNVHSLAREENERVCREVKRLMEEGEYRSQSELGAALVLPDGSTVSQAVISQALHGGQVGFAFARAVARLIGVPIEELLTGVVNRPGVPKNKELPGWEQAAQKVIENELLPTYVVRIMGESYLPFPVEKVNAGLVYDLGAFWIKHAPVSVRKDAEREDIREEERRLAEEEERREERNKSGQVQIDRRSHVAPLQKKSKGHR